MLPYYRQRSKVVMAMVISIDKQVANFGVFEGWDKICGECGGRQSDLKQQAMDKTAAVAAAVTAALAEGDWETLLSLEPNNKEGKRLRDAAVTAALAKGDWRTLLDLDPDNSDGLRWRPSSPPSYICHRSPAGVV